MKVLYLGANLRMKQSTQASPEIRARGLKQGLEQAGVEVIPWMAGDHLNVENSRSFYSNRVKALFPPRMASTLRDLYEMFLDQKLFALLEPQIREIKPDMILQKHTRYGQAGVRMGHRHNIPVFLDDIVPIWEGEIYNDRSLKTIARIIRKRVFRLATGLNAVSHEMEIELKSEGVPDEKICYVPNGVDCTLFDPDAVKNDIRSLYRLSDRIVVGYVGIFANWHRLDLLVKVGKQLAETIPNIHFLLVGNDQGRKINELVHQQGAADLFTLPGSVPHDQIPAYLNAMDFCVLPATLPYMSPLKIYEYMAMRKPVIAPTGNSITESMIIPSQNGLLFEPENEDALAYAIFTLAARPDRIADMGIKARQFVEGNYTWYHQTRHLLEAFYTSKTSLGAPRTTTTALP